MSGIVLISDTHFDNRTGFGKHLTNPEFPGCNNRFHEIVKAFREATAYAVKNDCEAIVLLGDIFHSRGMISIPIYNGVYSLFNEVSKQVPLIIYPGNHDYVDLKALHADKNLHSLFTYEKTVRLYDKASLVQLENFDLGIIPFSPVKDDLLFNAIDLKKGLRKNKANMLCLHHSVAGAVTGPHEWKMPHELQVNEIPEWDFLWSGHYHQHQQIGNLWYVGAPLHHDLGERTYTPGFVHVFPNGSWKHIENKTSPRFVSLETDSHDLISKLDPSNYNVVKWTGEITEGDKLRLNENMVVNNKPSSSKIVSRTSISTTEDPEEMIKKYANAKIKNVEQDLIKYGIKLYKGE